MNTDIVIVGAGAAGLSTAGALTKRRLTPVVIERDRKIGTVWEQRYDRLRLHTVYSGLAHYPLPREYPRYPSKDQYASYLRSYAAHFRLQIIAGCTVERVQQGTDQRWVVRTTCGTWQARVVIMAVGQYGAPQLPEWPGMAEYQGEILHSSTYRSAAPFVGKRVLVVGLGNSGAEIATDLVEGGAASVTISVRTPPPVVPRDPFGMPVQRTSLMLSVFPPRVADLFARAVARLTLGDLRRYGLPPQGWAPYSAGRVPVIDVGFTGALKRGAISIRPRVAGLTRTGVLYQGGQTEDFDVLIAATGFRSPLPELLDAPGTLDAKGEPLAASGAPTSEPGLYFIGNSHTLRGHLLESNHASQRLAREVERYLRS